MYHKTNIQEVQVSGKIIPIDGKIFWHIENFTTDMEKFKVILAFEKMFKIYQPYFRPVFTSTSNIAESQITVRFKKNGDAGLPSPFNQNTLAYAYLANNTTAKGLVSDIFFNDAYNWAEMHAPGKVNLLKVGVHEGLHSAGLHHSNDPKDILFWQYQPNNEINITEDTKQSIYSLYGEPEILDNNYLIFVKELFDKKSLKRLNEDQLLIIADNLDIEAYASDLKKETREKIIEALK